MDRYQTAFTVIFEEGSEPFHILDEKYVQTALEHIYALLEPKVVP